MLYNIVTEENKKLYLIEKERRLNILNTLLEEKYSTNLEENKKDLYNSSFSDYMEPVNKKTEGIYYAGINFNMALEDTFKYKIKEFYSFMPDNIAGWRICKNPRANYGVCDNYKQILRRYYEIKKLKDRRFVIVLSPIYKKNEPLEYGWRWHKWGEYIGKHKITSEYLYDEAKIDMVYVYHIYELLNRRGK